MRLFIAITLPENIKQNIKRSAGIVKKYSVKGSFPEKENYHITLAFLGEVDEDRIPLIRSIMDLCRVDAFPVSVEEIGAFSKKDGDVVHRIIESTKRLYNLQDKLARLLTKNGFVLEKCAFTPHITIGRRVKYGKDICLNDIVELPEMEKLYGIDFFATSMHLTLSEHIAGGQKYTSLYQVDFLDDIQSKSKE